jgi:hypothetical protein
MSGWNVLSWYSLFAGVGLKSMAVLSAAGLAAILLRGRSAAARHLVWTAAAAAWCYCTNWLTCGVVTS